MIFFRMKIFIVCKDYITVEFVCLSLVKNNFSNFKYTTKMSIKILIY